MISEEGIEKALEDIENLKADLLNTQRNLAKTIVSLFTVAVVLNMKITDPILCSKLKNKIPHDAELVYDKITKSDDPLSIANEYTEQMNHYLE